MGTGPDSGRLPDTIPLIEFILIRGFQAMKLDRLLGIQFESGHKAKDAETEGVSRRGTLVDPEAQNGSKGSNNESTAAFARPRDLATVAQNKRPESAGLEAQYGRRGSNNESTAVYARPVDLPTFAQGSASKEVVRAVANLSRCSYPLF